MDFYTIRFCPKIVDSDECQDMNDAEELTFVDLSEQGQKDVEKELERIASEFFQFCCEETQINLLNPKECDFLRKSIANSTWIVKDNQIIINIPIQRKKEIQLIETGLSAEICDGFFCSPFGVTINEKPMLFWF